MRTERDSGFALAWALIGISLALWLWASGYRSTTCAVRVTEWSSVAALRSTLGASAALAAAMDLLARGAGPASDGSCSVRVPGPDASPTTYVLQFSKLSSSPVTWRIEVRPATDGDTIPSCSGGA